MFLLPQPDSDSWLAIPQVSHAWLAWQLADHWGNREFPRPRPRAEVLAGVLLHDLGWVEVDRDPGVDSDGMPRTFDRMPVDLHMDIWRKSVAAAGQFCRYAGLLVSDHFVRLAREKRPRVLESGGEDLAGIVDDYCSEMLDLQQEWRVELSEQPRFAPFLAGPAWEANQLLLAACDTIALCLCAGNEPPFSVRVPSSAHDGVQVVVSAAGENLFRVRPWPLQGDRVRLRCEARRLPALIFEDREGLAQSLCEAPVEQVGFTLMRSSARG